MKKVILWIILCSIICFNVRVSFSDIKLAFVSERGRAKLRAREAARYSKLQGIYAGKRNKISRKYRKKQRKIKEQYTSDFYVRPKVKELNKKLYKEKLKSLRQQEEREFDLLEQKYNQELKREAPTYWRELHKEPPAMQEKIRKQERERIREQERRMDEGYEEYYERQDDEVEEWERILEENRRKAREMHGTE